jgi:hypothetical protein
MNDETGCVDRRRNKSTDKETQKLTYNMTRQDPTWLRSGVASKAAQDPM